MLAEFFLRQIWVKFVKRKKDPIPHPLALEPRVRYEVSFFGMTLCEGK
jgi:hypothetical protein